MYSQQIKHEEQGMLVLGQGMQELDGKVLGLGLGGKELGQVQDGKELGQVQGGKGQELGGVLDAQVRDVQVGGKGLGGGV